MGDIMNPTKKTARMVGALYLLLAISGIFGLIYVPGKLFVQGDAAGTINNILASQVLFRLYIMNGVMSAVLFMLLVFALYQLFKDVDRTQARLMLIFVVIQVPMALVSTLSQVATLECARGAGYLSVFSRAQLDGLAMLFLHMDSQLTIAFEFFWGLWLFPLGWLVIKSRYLPRFVGIWLILNGAAYVVSYLVGTLSPEYVDMTGKVVTPFLMGELVFMLWLLIMGIRPPKEGGPIPSSAP